MERIVKYSRIFFLWWITFVFLFSNFEFLHSHRLKISIPTNNQYAITQFHKSIQNIFSGLHTCLIETFIKTLQFGFFFDNLELFFETVISNYNINLLKFSLAQNQIQLPIPRSPPSV